MDSMTGLIQERKQQINKYLDILRNDKFYRDCVRISKDVDSIIKNPGIDCHFFLQKVLLFGMVLTQSFEIKNATQKVIYIAELCQQFKDYVPQPLTHKEEINFLISTAISEIKFKKVSEFQVAYKSMVFPQNLSFKHVLTNFLQILDLVYNVFAGVLNHCSYISAENHDHIRRCDEVLRVLINQQIQDYFQKISSIQLEEQISGILKLNGITSTFGEDFL